MFFGKSQIFFCLKLRQIGVSEGDEGGAGHTVYSDQIDRRLEQQILDVQTAMTVQLVPDDIFDGVEGLILGAKHMPVTVTSTDSPLSRPSPARFSPRLPLSLG